MADVIRPSKERNILDLAKNLQDELHVYCKGAAGSGDNFYARTFANLADRADELVKLLESAPETGACGCPEVCKVCGGRANSCALLGHRPEADRSVKWHECKANAQKAKLGETLPDTLVRWMSHDTWRCRCKSPGDINIKLCNYCGGCGTHRPEKSEPE